LARLLHSNSETVIYSVKACIYIMHGHLCQVTHTHCGSTDTLVFPLLSLEINNINKMNDYASKHKY